MSRVIFIVENIMIMVCGSGNTSNNKYVQIEYRPIMGGREVEDKEESLQWEYEKRKTDMLAAVRAVTLPSLEPWSLG